MSMHPGHYLQIAYLAPLNLSCEELECLLGESAGKVPQLISQEIPVTASMALRLEAVFAKPAEDWLRMQLEYDLEQAKQTTDVSKLTRCRRLNELWMTGVPKLAGDYLWREAPGSYEHQVEVFYRPYGDQMERCIRCYSLTDFSFVDDEQGQWRLA